MSRKRVVLLSPNPLGDYAVCVAELIARDGIEVAAIFVRKLADLGRVRREIAQEGLPFFARKVARKLLFRNRSDGAASYETMAQFKARLSIESGSLGQFAQAHGAALHSCRDFNDLAVCTEIARLAPDAVIFTGGGLVRQPLLEACNRKIIACHPGHLPDFRGMDCLEWALLEGRPERMGVSTFLIDEGVDTGAVLKVHSVELQAADRDFATLRARLEPLICEYVAETVREFLTGALIPREQALGEGRQFFLLHPELKRRADALLAQSGGR